MTKKPQRQDMSWLGEVLKAPGRSQTALAKHLGLDKGAITRIIQGKRSVKVEESIAIQEYLQSTGKLDGRPRLNRPDIDFGRMRDLSNAGEKFLDYDTNALIGAVSDGNDLDIIRLSARQLSDIVFQKIVQSFPIRDDRALEALVMGHLRGVELHQVAALGVCMGLVSSKILDLSEPITRMCNNIADFGEADVGDLLRFYRDCIVQSGLSARDDLPADRALFAMIVAKTMQDIGAGPEATTSSFRDWITEVVTKRAGVTEIATDD